MEDLYKILGVKKDSTLFEIKQAYLKKIKKYHPDTFNGDKFYAEQITAKLNEAYSILKNEETRRTYTDSLPAKSNKFKSFFKKLFSSVKCFFVKIFSKFKNLFKKKQKYIELDQLTKLKIKNKRLLIILTIETILIFFMLILLFIISVC